MRFGVISDTHGREKNTRQAVRLLQQKQVDCVLHCGDVGSPEIVPLLAEWPTHYVLGNVDLEIADRLQAAIEQQPQHTLHGRFAELEIAGRKIAMLHGDDLQRKQKEIESGTWDLLLYGHTHQAACDLAGEMIVLNPGALHRAAEYSIAIVEASELDIEIVALERS